MSATAHRSLDLFDAMRRHWHAFVWGIALTSILGVVYWFAAPRTYESEVEILVIKKDPAITSVQSFRPSDGRSDVEDVLPTHMRLLSSRQVILDAIESSGIDNLPGMQSHAKGSDPRFDKRSQVAEYISDQLSVSRGGTGQSAGAQVLSASFRHTNADETEQILAAIVESYRRFLAETFSGVGTQAFDLFEQSKDGLSAELKAAERRQAEFLENAPVVFSQTGSVDLYEQQLAELLDAKNRLEGERSAVSSRLKMVGKAINCWGRSHEMDCLALIDQAHVERLNLLVSVQRGNALSEEFQAQQPMRVARASVGFEQMVELQLKADEMASKFGPEHPHYRNLDEAIERLKGVAESSNRLESSGAPQLTTEDVVLSYRTMLEHDLLHFDRQLTDIEARVERTTDLAQQARKYGAEHQVMAAELTRKQQLYSAVVARLPELGMTNKFSGFLTEIIAPVSIAEKAWPKIPQLGLLTLALGLCLGLAGVAYAEMNQSEFHSAGDISSSIGLPVLGVINEIKSRLAESSVPIHAKLISATEPQSTAAEAIRFIRTALTPDHRMSQSCKVIQFAGATPGVGTSLAVSNVAVAMAALGKQVLLIDADIRHPSLEKLAATESASGLVELLMDTAQLPTGISCTEIDHLDLLPAVNVESASPELLGNRRLDDLLIELRQRYDFIFLDSPPVLTVSDALTVAPCADGVVLVVPAGHSAVAASREALNLLRSVNAHVIGVVINDRHRRLPAREQDNYVAAGNQRWAMRDPTLRRVLEVEGKHRTGGASNGTGNGATKVAALNDRHE